jgi:hypothetical protein
MPNTSIDSAIGRVKEVFGTLRRAKSVQHNEQTDQAEAGTTLNKVAVFGDASGQANPE